MRRGATETQLLDAALTRRLGVFKGAAAGSLAIPSSAYDRAFSLCSPRRANRTDENCRVIYDMAHFNAPLN